MDTLVTFPRISCVVNRLLRAYDEPEPQWNGNAVLINIPDGIAMWCHPTFAAGYHRAMTMCFDLYQQELLFLPSDLDFTALIDEQLPETVSLAFVNEWRKGFMFAWMMMLHRPIEPHQFKQLQAQTKGYRKPDLPHDVLDNQEKDS